jgi:ribosomal protein S25
VSDFLQAKQKEINKRLAELRPLVEEYERLRAADAALDGLPAARPAAPTARRQSAPARRGPGRPRGSRSGATTAVAAPKAKRASAGKARRGRPKGGGKRAIEALKHITSQPGITIPELAQKMGIKQNYLYRVLPTLEQAGSVVKKGKGWHTKS